MQAFLPDTLWEIGGLAATLYSIGQARQHHDEQLQQSRKHHDVEMDLAVKQHRKNLVETKRVYLLELFTNLEQHFQQLNADLISSSKEAERDMFDQRNQNFQTIILASSVMFTALSTVIIDGSLPEASAEGLIVAFSLTSALSFAFLFLSMVICMELVMRASSFMYRRARNHTEQLRQAIKDTKLMMEELRNGTRNHHNPSPPSSAENSSNNREVSNDSVYTSNTTNHGRSDELSPDDGSMQYSTNDSSTKDGLSQRCNAASSLKVGSSGPGLPKTHSVKKHRAISELDEEGLEREWNNHETELQRFLTERERINDATALLGSSDKNGDPINNIRERLSSRKSFQEFWSESCKFWAELSILFFYGGTINLLLAIMIFMWSQFFHQYHSLIGAVIAISLISFTLVLGLCSVIVLRYMKAMEMQYHPDEANRRRVGHRSLHSFSASTKSQNNSSSYFNGRSNANDGSSGRLSSPVSRESGGDLDLEGGENTRIHNNRKQPLNRGVSISYLPEFRLSTDDNLAGVDSPPLAHADRKELRPIATSPSFLMGSSQQNSTSTSKGNHGIAMTSFESPSRSLSRAVYSPHSNQTNEAVPALFRRPSPRNLFGNANNENTYETESDTHSHPPSIGLPPRPIPHSQHHSHASSSQNHPNHGHRPPPSTPSSTDTTSSYNDSTPPVMNRRNLLGRQSSAPSTLSSATRQRQHSTQPSSPVKYSI